MLTWVLALMEVVDMGIKNGIVEYWSNGKLDARIEVKI
jgi:hypothetical protein